MAFNIPADLTIAYSELSAIQIRQASIIPPLLDRRWEPLAQTQYTVNIANPSYNTTATAYTRDGNFKALLTSDQAYISLVMSQHGEVGNALHYLDEIETPLNYLNGIRSDQSISMANYIDSNLLTYIAGLSYHANQTIRSTTTSAANVWDISNDAYGNSVGQLLYRQINEYGDEMLSIGAINGGGESPSDFWCLMSVKQFRAVVDYLQGRNFSLDPLTESMLTRSSVFQQGYYRGMLNGVTLVVQPKHDPEGDASSAGDDVNMFFGCRQSIAFAERTPFMQFIRAEENQTTPDHLMRMISTFGRIRVATDTLYVGGVESVA